MPKMLRHLVILLLISLGLAAIFYSVTQSSAPKAVKYSDKRAKHTKNICNFTDFSQVPSVLRWFVGGFNRSPADTCMNSVYTLGDDE